MLTRSAPMKRTPFKSKAPAPTPAKQVHYVARPRQVAVASVQLPMAQPVLKHEPVRHESYRRLVAALPCELCRAQGISQAAHPNANKGLAAKTDDRLCFPLCADQPGRRGCHSKFDQGALFVKWRRRVIEAQAGVRTRAEIQRRGLWPADLAPWPLDDKEDTA